MKYFSIILVTFLISCWNKDENNNDKLLQTDSIEKSKEENVFDYIEVSKDSITVLLSEFCSLKKLEFIDLYPIQDSIANDKYEKLVLVDILKSKGFKVTNWGRGNWMKGPRIVCFTMSDGQCECQASKLYYATGKKGEFKVTELIECKKVRKQQTSKGK